jgi:hypothetical protein
MISGLDHKNDSIVGKIHALLQRSYREKIKGTQPFYYDIGVIMRK